MHCKGQKDAFAGSVWTGVAWGLAHLLGWVCVRRCCGDWRIFWPGLRGQVPRGVRHTIWAGWHGLVLGSGTPLGLGCTDRCRGQAHLLALQATASLLAFELGFCCKLGPLDLCYIT